MDTNFIETFTDHLVNTQDEVVNQAVCEKRFTCHFSSFEFTFLLKISSACVPD